MPAVPAPILADASLEDVDPLELAVTDARLEQEDRRLAVAPLVDVAEVLEDLGDDGKQCHDHVTALIRPVDGGASEDATVREQRPDGLDVVRLDRCPHGMTHKAASSA